MESELSANGETKLSDLAYRRFKEALFQKQIAAGAIVSQADLVAITGVPITPLRDAMQVLQSEGIIQILPRSGIKIAKPDLALLRNAFQMRQILEVPALRHVAEAMPKHDLKALESKHQALLKGAPGTAMTACGPRGRSVDHAMHRAFIRFMDDPLLTCLSASPRQHSADPRRPADRSLGLCAGADDGGGPCHHPRLPRARRGCRTGRPRLHFARASSARSDFEPADDDSARRLN